MSKLNEVKDDFVIDGYPQQAEETDDVRDGGRIIIEDAVKILGANLLLFIFLDDFWVNTAAAGGIICMLILLFKPRHSREVLLANYMISALPLIVLILLNFVTLDYETSLGGWVFLFSLLGSIFIILVWLIVVGVYVFLQIVAYIDFFEISQVEAYLNSKKKK